MAAIFNLLVAVVFGAMTMATLPIGEAAAAESDWSAPASRSCGPDASCIEVAATGCVPNNQPVAQGQVCCSGARKFVNGAMRCVVPTNPGYCTNPANCCPVNRPQPAGCNCNCP